MSRLELSIAWRYMRSRRGSRLLSLISVIAVSGVIVGVSALIVILGVMDGLQTDLREKILVASPDIRVLPYGPDMVLSDSVWEAARAKVMKQPLVTAVAPFVTTVALVSANHDYIEGVQVMGIVPGDDLGHTLPVTAIRDKASAGDFTFRSSDGGHRGVVLGDQLAARLSVSAGIDSVVLTAMKGNRLDPLTGQPAITTHQYPVTGTFRTGMYEYDNSYVMMSLQSAQELAQLGKGVTGLEIRTPTRWDAQGVADSLQSALGMGLHTVDWREQNLSLFQALALEKIGMVFILFLISLVAAFNIVGTLTMVVADKTREIGILRAMGMRARSISRVFFAQGMFIGLTGTVAGLALGLVVSKVIDKYHLIPLQESVYFIDHLPVTTEWMDVVKIVVASMIISALATIYPARLAARLYPVEAIRHE